ncbi:hypothetical protein LTR96_001019 [Exophiala xenobiotica]|nr:hypothetical protein LTR96_001019 [Exophiala xenobiotica]KAK5343746.1 hypothetical protein LTR98_001376 [Exophiala xenobiotica]
MASDLALWMAVWDKLGMLSPSHPFHQAWHVVVEQEKVEDFPYKPWAEILEQTTEDNKRFLGQAENWQDAIVLQSRARTAPYQTVLKPGCGLVSPLRSRARPESPDPAITSLQIGCGPCITFDNHTQCPPEDMWRETPQDAVVLDVPSSYIAAFCTNHNPLIVALLIVLSLAVLLLASLGISTIVCWISSLLPKNKSRITVWSLGAIQVKPGNDDAVDVLKESSLSQSSIITMQSTESPENIDRAIQPATRSNLSMSGDTLQSIDSHDDADTEAVQKEQESMVILQDTVNNQNNLIRDKNDRIDKLLDEVQRLNTKVANQSRHLKEMEQSRTLKTKKDECKRLQKAVETAEERITDLEGQISDGEIEYQKLKFELDDAKEQIQKIGENMEEEVKEKNDLQAAKGLLAKALGDARPSDWKAARDNLERDLSSANTELREQQELANVTEQTLQKEKTRLQQALEYSNVQLQKANAERDDLRIEVENTKAEKDQLLKDLNEANSRVENGERALTSVMQSLAKDEPEPQQESEQNSAQLAQAVVERERSEAALNEIDAQELVTHSVSEKVEAIVSAVALQKDEKDPEFNSGDKPNSGKKRKSTEASPTNPDDIELPDGMPIEWSAQQIRAKIRQYVNSGEMKVGEFQKKLDVSSTSYNRFMAMNGADKGTSSDTYFSAAEFFKRRELAGLKMPRQKKAKTTGDSPDTNKSGSTTTTPKKSKKDEIAEVEKANDVSDITLPGEEDDSVPVFDTCDDIRTKIKRYMRETPHATGAGFVRTAARALPENSERRAAQHGLTKFLNAKGPSKGAESNVFYTAYVFFEKLRIKQGKPKSKKREEMEKEWGRQGMKLRDSSKVHILMGPGLPGMHADKYGIMRNNY